MALHALEVLDDALDATRRLLTPVDRTLWVKLAVVAFFVGGTGGSFNPLQFSFGGSGTDVPPMNGSPNGFAGALDPGMWLLVAGVVLVAVVLGLAFLLVGSVMEFVFVETLRSEELHVRSYWSRYWRRGLRLFGFRVVLGLLGLASVAVLAAPLVWSLLVPGIDTGLSVVLLLFLVPAAVVLAVVLGVVNGFTTVFVVPIMLLEDCGVLAGWRRLWSTITRAWVDYLAYAVVGFVLAIVGGMLVGILTALVAVALLLPFGVVAAVGVAAFLVFPPLGIAWFALTAVLFVLATIAVAALVQVPVQTYLRYYALLFLGDVEPDFDAIPDQRIAIRRSADET